MNIAKKIVFVLIMFLSPMLFTVKVNAASANISANKTSVTVGTKVTVTVKIDAAAWNVKVSGDASDSIVGFNMDAKNQTTTKTYTINTSKVGSYKVSISGDVTDEKSNNAQNVSGSVTITVKEKSTPTKPTTPTTPSKPTVTKSSDNKLSSLTVSEGTLTPAFKADVTEYNVNVGATVSKITLSAKANHDKAKVSGTGEKTLNVGKNTFEVKCTAENGSVKTYKVNVHVDETPLVFTTYKDQRLGVVRNTAGLGVPKTFEKTTITLDGQSVEAYQSNQFNKTIVYLQTDAGEKNFYIYEEGNGIVSIFKPVSICGVNVYVYDIAESDIVRDNMTYQSVNVGGVEMNGWVFVNPRYENYSLIKVMNEFGNEVMYSYEKTEGTLQLYTEYVEEEEQVVEESEISTLEYILMGTTGFFALTTLIAFVSHLRFKKKSIAAIKDYYQRRNQE